MTEWLDEQSVADLSKGKTADDGYRGVYLYYQMDSDHYPIEIQFNALYDRQLNNWLHGYLDKKAYPNEVGQQMRARYENGKIRNQSEFEKALDDALSGG